MDRSSPTSNVWFAKEPLQWPKPPKWMSFYKLIDIEKCPRRFALSNARYSDIWEHSGYPGKVNQSGLSGTIVHKVLRMVLEELQRTQCESTYDSSAVVVLKRLGGFSAIIRKEIKSILGEIEKNPRESERLELIEKRLYGSLNSIRETIQLIMPLICFNGKRAKNDVQTSPTPSVSVQKGVYSEIEVHANKLGWKGIIDVLSLSDHSNCIMDYKTGKKSDTHLEQLKIYSLLWFLDSGKNPSKSSIDKLKIIYPTAIMDYDAPSLTELNHLEINLKERTQKATEELNLTPPNAIPNIDNCKYCYVRQLCTEYWLNQKLMIIDDGNENNRVMDIELNIVEKLSEKYYVGIPVSPGVIPDDTLVTICMNKFAPQLILGDKVRILSASISKDDQNATLSTLTSNSEVFISSRNNGAH